MLIVRAIFGFGTELSLQAWLSDLLTISIVGVASSVVLCPLYVAETVDPQKRGLMGGIFQVITIYNPFIHCLNEINLLDLARRYIRNLNRLSCRICSY
jgi:hypothetical protein